MPIAKHEFVASGHAAALAKIDTLSGTAAVKEALKKAVEAVADLEGSVICFSATVDTAMSGSNFWTDSVLIDVRSMAQA